MPRKTVKVYSGTAKAVREAARRDLVRRGKIAAARSAGLTRGRIVRGYTRSTGFYGRYPPMGDELKFFDTTHSFTTDLTAEVPATGQLNLIPQGVTESTRVGRKCVIKSLKTVLTFYLNPGAGSVSSDVIALYHVLDTQCNGAAAAYGDVFTTPGGTSNAPTALRNLNNVERFRILKKTIVVLNGGAGILTALSPVTTRREIVLSGLNIPLEFSSTTGAITEIRSNNIFLIAGSNSLDDFTTVSGQTRVRFSDS